MAIGLKTGGRRRGSINKKTADTVAAIESTGLTPLAYMIGVLQDEDEPAERRAWAAKEAAPYVHAKLASVDLSNKDGKPFVVELAATDPGLI